jgi:flavin reductase (DIM6/NTAB) family NADH-FMN oxidoreductase RutF
MSDFTEKDYKAFELFEKQWALVTAGSLEHFNGCTVGWGCLGTLWNKPVVAVYLHPARYTREFMQENDSFTVCFFPNSCRKALGIMGSRSGRDGDKVRAAGLTPVAMGDSVGYREASLSFLCRKLYQHRFSREDLAPEIREYYRAHPGVFPPDEEGQWQPHWVFVGEILETRE